MDVFTMGCLCVPLVHDRRDCLQSASLGCVNKWLLDALTPNGSSYFHVEMILDHHMQTHRSSPTCPRPRVRCAHVFLRLLDISELAG
jgi:hypothetical protein